ncbi:MAG: alpha-amylase, partial [Gemmatimonadota bacterium]
ETGTRLLLAPGMAQIYYGDEVARPLRVEGAVGDANLRSPMDWARVDSLEEARVLEHWRILGRYRRAHPAVGAGAHTRLQEDPYVFARTLAAGGVEDRVVVALGAGSGRVRIPVGGQWPEGSLVRDAYSGTTGVVSDGAVTVETTSGVILLEASGRD